MTETVFGIFIGLVMVAWFWLGYVMGLIKGKASPRRRKENSDGQGTKAHIFDAARSIVEQVRKGY